MKNKKNPSFRNAQDMIDSTYNSRDFDIPEKNMNAYVMPLDMIRDVDIIDTQRFYEDEWSKIINSPKQH